VFNPPGLGKNLAMLSLIYGEHIRVFIENHAAGASCALVDCGNVKSHVFLLEGELICGKNLWLRLDQMLMKPFYLNNKGQSQSGIEI